MSHTLFRPRTLAFEVVFPSLRILTRLPFISWLSSSCICTYPCCRTSDFKRKRLGIKTYFYLAILVTNSCLSLRCIASQALGLILSFLDRLQQQLRSSLLLVSQLIFGFQVLVSLTAHSLVAVALLFLCSTETLPVAKD